MPSRLSRQCARAAVALTLAAGLCAGQDAKRYFAIQVVDAQTGRGVPLVELRTVNGIRHYTDSAGIVAFHEPGLMDRKVFFHAAANEFKRRGLDNVVINVAGDVDARMIREFEQLRTIVGWEANRLSYMIGGSLTAGTLPTPLTRSRVAAVFKLCQTGERPTMKISDDEGEGKRSIPGQPVIWRRLRGDGPVGIVAQAGEPVPENYVVLNGNPEVVEQIRIVRAYPRLTKDGFRWGPHNTHSDATKALVAQCVAEHEAACSRLR